MTPENFFRPLSFRVFGVRVIVWLYYLLCIGVGLGIGWLRWLAMKPEVIHYTVGVI